MQYLSFSGKCGVCGVASINGFACSRRCEWMSSCCCPQCGRGRHPHLTFCGPSCIQESRHANWCPHCGLRQLAHGGSNCGSAKCNAAAQGFPHRGVTQRSRTFTPHSVLAHDDKLTASVRSQLSEFIIEGIMKIGGFADQKKRYAARRSAVEAELNQYNGIGAPKFGHGGEGNEHRRFLLIRSECGFQCANGKNCGCRDCDVCGVLDQGSESLLRTKSLTTWSSPRSAVDASPQTEKFALLICRVIVGNPILDSLQTTLANGFHSFASREASHDMVTVADEDAIDPMFLIILSRVV